MLGLTAAVNPETLTWVLMEKRNFETFSGKLIIEFCVKLKTVFSTQLVRLFCLHFLCSPALPCTGREKGEFFSEKINKIHMIMLFIWRWYLNTNNKGWWKQPKILIEYGSVTCPHFLVSDGWSPSWVWVFPPLAASDTSHVTQILASDWPVQVPWP